MRMPVLVLVVSMSMAFAQTDQAGGAGQAAASVSSGEVLQRVDQLRALGVEGAAAGGVTRSVSLRGVVTFSHTARQTFYLQDATGGILVSLADERMAIPAPGDDVAVAGTSASVGNAVTVRANHITKLGSVEFPAARPLTFEDAMAGRADDQWVEIEGVLTKTDLLDGWLRLEVERPEGAFSVSIPANQRTLIPTRARIRIQGVCATWRVAGSDRVGGFFLFTPSLGEVRTVQQASSPAGTLSTVAEVLGLRRESASAGRRVYLRGVVTFAHPQQRFFYLKDHSRGVQVWLKDDTLALPRVGRVVEVEGLTAPGAISPGVEATRVVEGDARALPVATVISLEQALTGTEDGQWVEMRGHLRQIETTAEWLRLTLTAAAGDFSVSIPFTTKADLKAGAFLRVRGVCVPWLNDKAQVGGVFVYTPSLKQIDVAEPPPDDPFRVQEESIGNLQNYRTETLEQARVLVRGTVLHHVPGRYLVV
jgi:uncharacterized protein YdeI (BOF family)